MKDIVQFFFDRYQRALNMDATNEILGKHCKYIFEATEWLDAFKATLSKGKQDEFGKEWRKLEQELAQKRNPK